MDSDDLENSLREAESLLLQNCLSFDLVCDLLQDFFSFIQDEFQEQNSLLRELVVKIMVLIVNCEIHDDDNDFIENLINLFAIYATIAIKFIDSCPEVYESLSTICDQKKPIFKNSKIFEVVCQNVFNSIFEADVTSKNIGILTSKFSLLSKMPESIDISSVFYSNLEILVKIIEETKSNLNQEILKDIFFILGNVQPCDDYQIDICLRLIRIGISKFNETSFLSQEFGIILLNEAAKCNGYTSNLFVEQAATCSLFLSVKREGKHEKMLLNFLPLIPKLRSLIDDEYEAFFALAQSSQNVYKDPYLELAAATLLCKPDFDFVDEIEKRNASEILDILPFIVKRIDKNQIFSLQRIIELAIQKGALDDELNKCVDRILQSKELEGFQRKALFDAFVSVRFFSCLAQIVGSSKSASYDFGNSEFYLGLGQIDKKFVTSILKEYFKTAVVLLDEDAAQIHDFSVYRVMLNNALYDNITEEFVDAVINDAKVIEKFGSNEIICVLWCFLLRSLMQGRLVPLTGNGVFNNLPSSKSIPSNFSIKSADESIDILEEALKRSDTKELIDLALANLEHVFRVMPIEEQFRLISLHYNDYSERMLRFLSVLLEDEERYSSPEEFGFYRLREVRKMIKVKVRFQKNSKENETRTLFISKKATVESLCKTIVSFFNIDGSVELYHNRKRITNLSYSVHKIENLSSVPFVAKLEGSSTQRKKSPPLSILLYENGIQRYLQEKYAAASVRTVLYWLPFTPKDFDEEHFKEHIIVPDNSNYYSTQLTFMLQHEYQEAALRAVGDFTCLFDAIWNLYETNKDALSLIKCFRSFPSKDISKVIPKLIGIINDIIKNPSQKTINPTKLFSVLCNILNKSQTKISVFDGICKALISYKFEPDEIAKIARCVQDPENFFSAIIEEISKAENVDATRESLIKLFQLALDDFKGLADVINSGAINVFLSGSNSAVATLVGILHVVNRGNYRAPEAYINRIITVAFDPKSSEVQEQALQMCVDHDVSLISEYVEACIINPGYGVEESNPGLKNLGTTCYFNSIIQQLYHIPFVRDSVMNARNSGVVGKLKELFHEMCIAESAVDTKKHFSAIYNRPVTIQEDAYEFYTKLLQELPPSVRNFFVGKALMPEEQEFTAITAIPGRETLSDSFGLTITDAPGVLVFQFQRSKADKSKDQSKVPIPLRFDATENDHYDLQGIVLHIGTTSSGHYYSAVRVKGKWMKFNDTNVEQIDLDVSKISSEKPYMLFYINNKLETNLVQPCNRVVPKSFVTNHAIKFVINNCNTRATVIYCICVYLLYCKHSRDQGFEDRIVSIASCDGDAVISALIDIIDKLVSSLENTSLASFVNKILEESINTASIDQIVKMVECLATRMRNVQLVPTYLHFANVILKKKPDSFQNTLMREPLTNFIIKFYAKADNALFESVDFSVIFAILALYPGSGDSLIMYGDKILMSDRHASAFISLCLKTGRSGRLYALDQAKMCDPNIALDVIIGLLSYSDDELDEKIAEIYQMRPEIAKALKNKSSDKSQKNVLAKLFPKLILPMFLFTSASDREAAEIAVHTIFADLETNSVSLALNEAIRFAQSNSNELTNGFKSSNLVGIIKMFFDQVRSCTNQQWMSMFEIYQILIECADVPRKEIESFIWFFASLPADQDRFNDAQTIVKRTVQHIETLSCDSLAKYLCELCIKYSIPISEYQTLMDVVQNAKRILSDPLEDSKKHSTELELVLTAKEASYDYLKALVLKTLEGKIHNYHKFIQPLSSIVHENPTLVFHILPEVIVGALQRNETPFLVDVFIYALQNEEKRAVLLSLIAKELESISRFDQKKASLVVAGVKAAVENKDVLTDVILDLFLKFPALEWFQVQGLFPALEDFISVQTETRIISEIANHGIESDSSNFPEASHFRHFVLKLLNDGDSSDFEQNDFFENPNSPRPIPFNGNLSNVNKFNI